MEIRSLRLADSHEIWKINEQGLPGTGKVSEDEMVDLLHHSSFAVGAFDDEVLLGFVICLPPGTSYGSLNYIWFSQNYNDFLYVDRIAVSVEQRNRMIGTELYLEVFKQAGKLGVPVTAEVNLRPPNPASVRFHIRHDFVEVGQVDHGDKAVIMMLRD